MSFLNKVQLLGNITQSPELKHTANGNSVCAFGLATNKKYKNKEWETVEKAQFHNLVLWGKTAEIASTYGFKGQKVYIEWEIESRSWEKDDGTKGYTTEIIVQNFQMLSFQDKQNQSNTSNNTKQQEETIDVNDLPF